MDSSDNDNLFGSESGSENKQDDQDLPGDPAPKYTESPEFKQFVG